MQTSNLSKYQSNNPVQQWLLNRFLAKIVELLKNKDIKTVADIGCGEGFGLKNLADNDIGKKFVGLDNSKTALALAREINPEFKYKQGDIYKLPFKDEEFDLVLCCEVLEHLEHPEVALAELNRISKKYVLLSVPWEPWFRLANFVRGKYFSRWGNHPEHVQLWSSKGFGRLVSKQFTTTIQLTSFPWQIAVAEKR